MRDTYHFLPLEAPFHAETCFIGLIVNVSCILAIDGVVSFRCRVLSAPCRGCSIVPTFIWTLSTLGVLCFFHSRAKHGESLIKCATMNEFLVDDKTSPEHVHTNPSKKLHDEAGKESVFVSSNLRWERLVEQTNHRR